MSEHLDPMGDHGLAMAQRFVQMMRTTRTYAIGNQVMTRHLTEWLESLAPMLEADGQVQMAVRTGDVFVNGRRLPLREKSLRMLDSIADEMAMRRIHGLTFRSGLTVAELEAFMRFFTVSERYKDAELAAQCGGSDIPHVDVLLGTEHLALGAAEGEASAAGSPALDENAPFGPALIAYEMALAGAEQLFARGALERGVEMRWVQRLVQPLAETIDTAEPVTLALVDIGHEDSGGTHAVHVTIAALAIGHALGLTRAELSDLGAAALLHDSGQPEIVRVLGAQMDEWSPADWKDAKQHTLLGVRRLAVATPLGPTSLRAMRTAMQHHAEDASQATLFAQIVSCADAFVSVLAHRAMPGSTLTPHEALGRVLAGYGERWHPAVRIALVRGIGLHPPGQVVRLDDGSLARTIAPTHDPERPIIERLTGPGGAALEGVPQRVEVVAPDRRIEASLPLSQWPGWDAGEGAAAA